MSGWGNTPSAIIAVLAFVAPSAAQTFSPPSRVMRHTPESPQTSAPPPQVPRPNQVRTWGPLFRDQVERCWKKPANEGENFARAIFSIRLNRDGTLDDARLVSTGSNTGYAVIYAASASRALRQCQPYNLPAEFYDQWRLFEPVFTERDFSSSQR